MKTLVIAPHPDDELLGCGGTLLRRRADGGTVGWVIMTGLLPAEGWSAERIAERDAEIETVRAALGGEADDLDTLNYPTTRLDTIPMGELVQRLSGVFQHFQPEEVLLPHRYDIHTDHRITFDAAAACTKWFRYPSVRRVLTYETLSETDFSLDPAGAFRPNLFVDITDHLATKLHLLQTYASELAPAPFPRSLENLRALAILRGAQAGCGAAEGFGVVKLLEG